MKRLIFQFFIIFSVFSYLCNPSCAVGKENIQSKIKHILSDSSLNGGKVAVYIKLLETGDVIYDYNKDLPLTPASNMKVLTTATALSKLRDTFRFNTSAYGNGSNGKIEGDLLLYGNGDPTYCVYFNKPPTKVLENMAKNLYEQGINTIEGDLVADDSFFDRNFRGKGWKEEYQFESYSAEISPLSLNENVLDIKVSPGKDHGSPGIINLFPPAGIFDVSNETKTSESTQSISATRLENTNKIIVSGFIPYNFSSVETYVTVHQPALYTASAFARILKDHGITLKGRSRLIDLEKESYKRNDSVMLCSHKSPPLPEIIAYINKESDNLSAEMLLKTLGGVYLRHGTSENGTKMVKAFLGQIGIDTSELVMVDGSGLSAENRLTARILVDLLSSMYFSGYRKSFGDSLSIAGVDGTLKKRLRDTAAKGNFRGKTGTLSGVSALSGYVTTCYGQTLVLSILSNDISEGDAKDTENRIVEFLAGYTKPVNQ